MKWRDVIAGSIATLVVTILSGVAVFYLTRSPEVKPSEILGYSIEQSASFESANNRVALVNVNLLNKGDAKADNVIGSIEFPFGSIKDKKIIPSSGRASGFVITSETDKQIDFSMPILLPKEGVSISFLMESSATPEPKVFLKSAKSIGEAISILATPQDVQRSLKKEIISTLIPVLFGLIMTLLLLLISSSLKRQSLSKKRLLHPSQGSLNNNGFVFLHKGLTDTAGELLLNAIIKGQDSSSHPIANYATYLAVKGNTPVALQYLSAAEFLAKSSHERAVVAFNCAIIFLLKKESEKAKSCLQEALKLSDEILFYCSNSSLLQNLIIEYPDIAAMINKPLK